MLALMCDYREHMDLFLELGIEVEERAQVLYTLQLLLIVEMDMFLELDNKECYALEVDMRQPVLLYKQDYTPALMCDYIREVA
jgi:hypothetical protein